MNWLERLKAENSDGFVLGAVLPKLPKAPFGSKDSAPHSAHLEISGDRPAPVWLLYFADREPLEVWTAPPATQAQVRGDYPDAITAELAPEHEGMAATLLHQIHNRLSIKDKTCVDCCHRRQPGLSAGYCATGRADLLPAYGTHHPLRRLPEDGGASCNEFKERVNPKDFIQERDGEVLLSAGAVLLMAGNAAYHSESERTGRRGAALLGALLGAAYRAGFLKCDLLRTLFTKGEVGTDRVHALCKEAMGLIPPADLFAAMRTAGLNPVGMR